MGSYRIITISGGVGIKVQVLDGLGGLRVIGVFHSAAEASDWIAKDKHRQLAHEPAPHGAAVSAGA